MQNIRTRIPLIVLSATLLLVWGVSPVADSTGGNPPPGVALHLPAWYVALSPVSRALDALSLLSNPQTVALFLSIAAIVIIGVLVTRSRIGRAQWKRLSFAIAALVVSIGVIEAAVVLLPRPMAQLRVSDPELVRIDFHSHTGASHDVRKSFTAEDNREWHRSGGFDVAYVSDHVKFDGAVAARAENPRVAGDGMSLLTAVEGRYHRIMSTIVLGLTERDTALLNRRGNLLPGTPAAGRMPVAIVALPNRNLDSLTAESLDSLPRFAGLELIDAAPRGLGQLDREEEKIRRIASDLRLVLVSASNNHGWGRAVAAWNLMRIPGWKTLPPDSLGRLIEEPLRNRQLDAVTIVERRRPRVHGIALAGTLPVLAYITVGSLTLPERFVWLAWLWGAALVFGALRRRVSTGRASTSP